MLDTTKAQDNGPKTGMNGITNSAFETHDAIEPIPDYEYSYIDHRGEADGMKRFVQPIENDYDGHDGKSKNIFLFFNDFKGHLKTFVYISN